MNKVIKIFQIDSDEDFIEISKINEYKIIDFGNGFFISNNGYLASVAHVLTNIGCNSFALYDGKLQKIEITERILTEIDENHIDVAIGKLNISQARYFNPLNFERVIESEELQLIGYSRKLKSEHSSNTENPVLRGSLITLETLCLYLKYAYSKYNDIILMQNSFTIGLNQTDLYGLSGCPVINKNNNVVGVFKGGSNLKSQVVHVNTVSKILRSKKILI